LESLESFHELGKEEDQRNQKSFPLIPSDDLKYAQVVKTRNNGVLEKVEKKTIFGKGIEQSEISTTLFERQNLTFR